MIPLLLFYFAIVTTTVGAQQQQQFTFSCRRKRRRNNTGFYYGIRDDDILYSKSKSSFCTRREGFKPILWRKLALSQGNILRGRLSANTNTAFTDGDGLCEKRHVEGQSKSINIMMDLDNSNSISDIERYTEEGGPLTDVIHDDSKIFPKQKPFHDRLAQYLSHSLAIHSWMDTNANHLQNNKQHLHRQQNQVGGTVLNSIFGKYDIKPTRRTGISRSFDGQMLASSQSSPVMNTSTKLLSKPKARRQQDESIPKKRRRKNNTGFYYGIREDVLFCPADGYAQDKRIGDGRGNLTTNHVESKSNGANSKSSSVKKGEYDTLRDQQLSAPRLTKPQHQPSSQQLDHDKQRNNDENRKQHLQKDSHYPNKLNKKKKKQLHGDGESIAPGLSNVLSETLFELREMKEDILSLRMELKAVKDRLRQEQHQQQGQQQFTTRDDVCDDKPHQPSPPKTYDLEDSLDKVSEVPTNRERFERIGRDVEAWATHLLFNQGEDRGVSSDGWKEISCNNFVKKKFNKSGRTQVYLKVRKGALYHYFVQCIILWLIDLSSLLVVAKVDGRHTPSARYRINV